MVVSKKDGKWSAPEQVNKTRSQIVRPTLAKLNDSVCALWTESGDQKLARIMFSATHRWRVVRSSFDFNSHNTQLKTRK